MLNLWDEVVFVGLIACAIPHRRQRDQFLFTERKHLQSARF